MGWSERSEKTLPRSLARIRAPRTTACYLSANTRSAPWGTRPRPHVPQRGHLWRGRLEARASEGISAMRLTRLAPEGPPSGGLTPLASVPWLCMSTLSPQPGCSLRWAVGGALGTVSLCSPQGVSPVDPFPNWKPQASSHSISQKACHLGWGGGIFPECWKVEDHHVGHPPLSSSHCLPQGGLQGGDC